MSNVLIFGFGAVGAVYGLILHRAGCSLTAVCRSNYEHVASNGVTVRSAIFGHGTYHPRAVKTIREAVEASQYDYIIVASKASPATAAQIHEAVSSEHTTIVLAQNGIGIEEEYAALYPSDSIISGVVYLPTTQVSPGVVEHGPLERFEIGIYPSTTSTTPNRTNNSIQHFSDLFKKGGANAPIYPDIQPQRWKKLAINAAWNPVSALTYCDDANLLRSSTQSLPLIKTIMAEVGTIATAAGYPELITPEFIEEDLQRPQKRLQTGGKEPSMLVDVKQGRRMEVEAILGNAVRMADDLGVGEEVPTLKVLYTLALARDFELRKHEVGSEWKGIARH